MKRLSTILLVALVACHRGTIGGGSAVVGAPGPDAAVNAFLAASKAHDLQGMSAVWGSDRGPARDYTPRADLESREQIMMRLLCHEQYRIAGRTQGSAGRQIVHVDLMRGPRTVTIDFTTVAGPGSRWFVENLELEKLQPFCR